MKRILLYFIIINILGLQACPNQSNSPDRNGAVSGKCPERPAKLSKKNVQQVALNSQMSNESGIVSQTKSIGYTFDAQKGQKITYKTNENVCVWVYTPDNELLNNAVLPKAGKYTIQVSAPKGSTTFELAMGLDVADSSSSNTANSSNSSPSFSQNSLSSSPITQDEAVKLVKNWQQAKRKIFAYPFDRNLGAEILTGEAYDRNIRRADTQACIASGKPKDDCISSVDWLQNNNAYYTYGVQQIDDVKKFIANRNIATIGVITIEERTLCVKGRVLKKNAVYDKSRVSYDLRFNQGKWKISNYNNVEQIDKRYNQNASC